MAILINLYAGRHNTIMLKLKLSTKTHPYLNDFFYAYTYARTPIAAMYEADALIYIMNDQDYLGAQNLNILEVSGSSETKLGFKNNMARLSTAYLSYGIDSIKTANITPDANYKWDVLEPISESDLADKKFNVVALPYYALATMVQFDASGVANPIPNATRRRIVKDCYGMVAPHGMFYANITNESKMYPPEGKLNVPKRFSVAHLASLHHYCVEAGMKPTDKILGYTVDVTFVNSTIKETHFGEDFIVDVGHALKFKGTLQSGKDFELLISFEKGYTKHIYSPCENVITPKFMKSLGASSAQYYMDVGEIGEAFLCSTASSKEALDASYIVALKGDNNAHS